MRCEVCVCVCVCVVHGIKKAVSDTKFSLTPFGCVEPMATLIPLPKSTL